jgi:hypothetical protein
MEYVVAAIMGAFAVLILVALFRRSTRDRTSNATPEHAPLGVQHYAGQGDIIRYTGDGHHGGAGEGGGGDGGGD